MYDLSPLDRDPDAFEDAGLFPRGVTRIQVSLLPRLGENARGDWIVSAFLPGGQEIDIIFAGRRVAAAKRLKSELMHRWALSCKKAAAKGKRASGVEAGQLEVLVEGGWRTLFERDDMGMEARRFQFVAARWTYFSSDNTIEVGGETARRSMEFNYNMTRRSPAAVAQDAYPEDIIL